MKKRILFGLLFLAFAVMLSLGICAKEYNPSSGEELNSALVEIASQEKDAVINLSGDYTSHDADFSISTTNQITFNLNGDCVLDYRIVIKGESRVVFNLNGHSLINKTSKGGDSGCLILMDDDVILEIYNGTLSISDVAVCFRDGTLKMENVDVIAKEEAIWCSQGQCDGSGRAYYINNCTFNAGDSGINIYCATPDSYVTDCEITKGSLRFDAWHKHGAEKVSTARFENITSAGDLENYTSSNGYVFENCSFNTIKVGGDGGGAGYFYIYDVSYNQISYIREKGYLYEYKSATCESAGSLTIYDASTQSSAIDEEYSISNPMLGHVIDKENAQDLIYTSYYENGIYVSTCQRCGATDAQESIGSALPLFVCRGYSVAEDDVEGGITLGYRIDNEAIGEYERVTGKDIVHGLFAVTRQALADGDVLGEKQEPLKGAFVAELPKGRFSILNLRINGITTDVQKSTELAIGMYVITSNGETKTVDYLQYTAPKEGEGYHFISYNDLINN